MEGPTLSLPALIYLREVGYNELDKETQLEVYQIALELSSGQPGIINMMPDVIQSMKKKGRAKRRA